MSIYINRVSGKLTKSGLLIGGVEVALYSQSLARVVDETHTHRGHWEFVDVSPGFYNIQFYGRGVTDEDWLFGIEVIDEATAGDSDPPVSSIVESANLESALKASKRSVELSNSANHWDTLSMVYWKMGEYENAIEAEEKALKKTGGTSASYKQRIEEIKKDMKNKRKK